MGTLSSDFGSAARDYARFRQGFPPSLFDRLSAISIGLPGQTLLDLGTGTGTLACGFAERGASVTAVDLSAPMLREARRRNSRIGWIRSRAERLPCPAGCFDAVTAGQCWIWFDGPVVAREIRRLLRPGGTVVLAHLDYVPREGNVSELTERLILRHNPKWPLAGSHERSGTGRAHLEAAGFRDLRFFSYEENQQYSHEAWRGRFRACNGVIALGDPSKIEAFDADLAALLEKNYPDPLPIPHRISVLTGTA